MTKKMQTTETETNQFYNECMVALIIFVTVCIMGIITGMFFIAGFTTAENQINNEINIEKYDNLIKYIDAYQFININRNNSLNIKGELNSIKKCINFLHTYKFIDFCNDHDCIPNL